MAKARSYLWTVEDFLAFEAQEPERYEFVDGVVRMMTGGSVAHSIIKSNMAHRSTPRWARVPVLPFVDELKVVTETAVMYPDVVVACGPLAPDDDRISDPAVVVEVLSPTTERHDRIAKWREYQRIGSLQHLVLIAQKERRIEVQSRTEAGWELVAIEPPDDAVALEGLGATLSLEEIYGAAAAEHG